jgi:hypothetical protein
MCIVHEECEDWEQFRKEKDACEGAVRPMSYLPVAYFEDRALASDG